MPALSRSFLKCDADFFKVGHCVVLSLETLVKCDIPFGSVGHKVKHLFLHPTPLKEWVFETSEHVSPKVAGRRFAFVFCLFFS